MQSYAQNQEYDKLESYLSSYHQSPPNDSTILYCKNQAVNVLLLYFAQQAKKMQLNFPFEPMYPSISEFLRMICPYCLFFTINNTYGCAIHQDK